MRFKIALSLDFGTYGNVMPINYQYELSSWIYHTLAKGDKEYAEWLHTNGFTYGTKKFKLFTFSNIKFGRHKIVGERIILYDREAEFFISFLPEKSTEKFIKGVFTSQQFQLGDRISKICCNVSSVSAMPTPELYSVMIFKTLSPMVISGHLSNGKDTYISPESQDAGLRIYDNLCSKYYAYHGKPYLPDNVPYNPETSGSSSSDSIPAKLIPAEQESISKGPILNEKEGVCLKILSPLKRKKVTIKAGTPQQTYVIGYLCDFKITLPKDLMKILYETGIGEKGSLGFGMVESIKQKNKNG